jgi:mono/diheme cytochrome c family protein
MRADGRGMAAPPGARPANLVDDTWDHGGSDAEIFKVIKEGVPPDYNMDAWDGRVSDDDIWNVINYLRDLAAE